MSINDDPQFLELLNKYPDDYNRALSEYIDIVLDIKKEDK